MDGLDPDGAYVGRMLDGQGNPCVVALREGRVVDVTTRAAPTMSALLDMADPWEHVAGVEGRDLGAWEEVEAASLGGEGARLLAPCDLQAVKACGVTFARSMIERVIEERAGGDPGRAEAVRGRIGEAVGARLRDLVPGSAEAAEVKRVLQAEGLWSQYLEVGIGPDAEVFTKCQPMAAVGHGAEVGLHPVSRWSNPEPEVVLAVDSRGVVKGAALGNDVNLRDVEGRSALLLGKAKDNNASAAIGPLIRLLDDGWGMEDVRGLELGLTVEGPEGFRLDGRSSMGEISRDPLDLVGQARGRHHQYPDGFVLYLGTMFAPTQDRGEAGAGFTHVVGDRVTVEAPGLGRLVNRVALSTEAEEWTFGVGALMRNLAGRGLL